MENRINTFWKSVIVIMTIIGVALTINQVFFLKLFGITLVNSAFLFFLLTFFLSLVFLIYPIKKNLVSNNVPWYDVVLFILTIIITSYFGINGENILNLGWDIKAPAIATIFSIVLWLIVLEALRRTAGLIVSAIALVFSLYPIFSSNIPIFFLQGISLDFLTTARSHVMGVDSILGLPLQAAGSILVGFLIFGIVLQKTGGATFFYDLSQALFGRSRGGSAKVAIVSSGFMGMMSGSAVSNVLTTGPMTIPAMKNGGFNSKYAAGIEATASSGGSITPPVMGTAAFLMVTFVGVPYSEIMIAAALPAILYYLGIYVQTDAYAAKKGLKGISKEEVPNFLKTLVSGWPYIIALFFLIYILVVTQLEAQAPFYTVAFLLIVSLFSKSNRLSIQKVIDIIYESGKTIGEILGIIAGVGLIVGGLSLTGVSLSLARELVSVVGDNVFLILVAGAFTSFILGMGMTISAVYVFLAIVMAPALVQLGINPIAAHLFVIYWASVSYITPPVALASFAAAGIAKSDPMKTSFIAMKLGSVKYIIPFLFAFNPNIIAQGTIQDYIVTIVVSIFGVIVLGWGLEGWVAFINVPLTIIERILVVTIGLLTFWQPIVGVILFSIIFLYLLNKKKKQQVLEDNPVNIT